MKKLLGLLLVSLLVLGGVQAAWAVDSTATQTFRCYGKQGDVCLLRIAWTAKSTDGSFTATALTAATMTTLAGYYLYEMETDPGATAAAPTDLYDITLTASATGYSYDVLGGRGADRATATTQAVFPANTTGSRFAPVNGADTWTLAITNNSNGSATGVIRLWFVK